MFRIVVKSATTRNSWVISGLLQISRRLTSCALIQILERSIDYRSRSFAINRLKELLPHLARFSLSLSLSLILTCIVCLVYSKLFGLSWIFHLLLFVEPTKDTFEKYNRVPFLRRAFSIVDLTRSRRNRATLLWKQVRRGFVKTFGSTRNKRIVAGLFGSRRFARDRRNRGRPSRMQR